MYVPLPIGYPEQKGMSVKTKGTVTIARQMRGIYDGIALSPSALSPQPSPSHTFPYYQGKDAYIPAKTAGTYAPPPKTGDTCLAARERRRVGTKAHFLTSRVL
jgi:hypothetical protein